MLDKARRVIADAPMLAAFDQGRATRLADRTLPGRLAADAPASPAERDAELLDAAVYQTTCSFDALNRIRRLQFPQDAAGRRRELVPAYSRAGALEQLLLDDTVYVQRIAYDARGQRSLIAYGNGVMTRYAYDPRTFAAQASPQRALHQTRRRDLPAWRCAAPGLRLRLRPGREHPEHR